MRKNKHKKAENSKNQNFSSSKAHNSLPAREQNWTENDFDKLTEVGFRRREMELKFDSSAYGYAVFSPSFIEEFVFSPMYALDTFVKNEFTVVDSKNRVHLLHLFGLDFGHRLDKIQAAVFRKGHGDDLQRISKLSWHTVLSFQKFDFELTYFSSLELTELLEYRLSSPNIYKYRTVPRRRRNKSKGRAGKETRKRKEGSEENGKGRKKEKSKDGNDGNEDGEREGLDDQDSTTVCKRPSPAVSKQEEAACAPWGLEAGGGGGGAQGPWHGRPGDEEDEALEGVQKGASRGCLSSRVSFAWVGACLLGRGSPPPPRLPLQ
ncbi:hypothetical protein AAY473_003479 [Plecturocebus cupreus]